jgi:hypothetical protein
MSTLSIRDAWPVSRGAGITVAVLSDGVDTTHPDLTGPRFITGPDYTGTGQSSGKYFGTVGTGEAGLIAAHGFGVQGQNGIIGAAPLANVLSVRVTLPPGDPLLTRSAVAAGLPGAIAKGIRYAVSHGATVIDLPLDPGQAGTSGTGGATAAAGGSTAEAAAVKYALSKNVVLVAPAGDDNLTTDAPNYPAAYPGVIAVGAFNKAFVKAPWTSHQRYVTLTAAGAGMTVATNTGGFRTAGSTAYASAVVTGIVAMIQGRFPGISVAQVRHALIKGTAFKRPGGRADGSGFGTVNANKALMAAAKELTSPGSTAGAQVTQAATPAAPVAATSGQSLVHSIIRSGIIAGGLLVVLLLFIVLYVISGRRREARRRAAAPPGWSRQGVTRHPRAGSAADAQQMAEYFAAPVNGRATTAVAERPVSRGLQPSTADRAFSGAGRPAPLGDPAARRSAQPPWDSPDAGSRPPASPASRAIPRRAAVSGAPPWEEAMPPLGDLPWNSADEPSPSGRHSTGRPPASPAAAAPGSRAPQPPAPQPSQSQAAAPALSAQQPGARQFGAPQFRAPQSGAPQSGAPQSGAPQSVAPQSGAPQSVAPQSGAQQTGAQQSAAPPFAGPELPARSSGSQPAEPGRFGRPVPPRHAEDPRLAESLWPADRFRPAASSGPAAPTTPAAPAAPAAPSEPAEPARTARTGRPAGSHADFRRPAFRRHASQAPADPPVRPAADPAVSASSAPDSSQPGDARPDATADRPGQSLTGRLDWARQQSAETPPGSQRELQVPGGPLPVRQPRATPPAGLSPSGSLWERNVEPSEETSESGSRPIFVWNPAAGADSGGGSSEPTREAPEWSLRGRNDRRSGD